MQISFPVRSYISSPQMIQIVNNPWLFIGATFLFSIGTHIFEARNLYKFSTSNTLFTRMKAYLPENETLDNIIKNLEDWINRISTSNISVVTNLLPYGNWVIPTLQVAKDSINAIKDLAPAPKVSFLQRLTTACMMYPNSLKGAYRNIKQGNLSGLLSNICTLTPIFLLGNCALKYYNNTGINLTFELKICTLIISILSARDTSKSH